MVSAMRHKASELQIDLENEEIVLLGHSSESAGKLLRGTVTLNLTEPMKIKSVTLLFIGKMKVSWSEGIGHHQHYHKQEKDIIEHRWQFVPIMDQAHKKAYTLGAGQHKWDFELLLPGDLPQSLQAEGGQVIYRLKAVVERTAFLQNIVKKQTVQIVRCMLPSEFELIQTLEIHNTWAEKMMYDILIPSKVYARGQLIPITFHITPIATKLRVRSLTGTLKEYCTYTANECSKTDTRIIKLQRVEDPFPASPTGSTSPISWTKVLQLDIPPMSSQLAFCDADNEMIRIRHKLKFIICLVNADGHLSELRCSVPVLIISSISRQTELNTLPAYDQSWRTVLCMESPMASPRIEHPSAMAAAAAASSSSTTSTATATDATAPTTSTEPIAMATPTTASGAMAMPSDTVAVSPTDDPLWWHGANLSRVPSYRTAAQQESAPFSTSLPSYDQLSVSPRHAAMFEQLSITPSNRQTPPPAS
ncbi:uncharacterized protein ATC70_012833 [Mucor velutinosus]|uniref:Arrestin C-terminal-like domain-containing protein n=1 Tax=Mucor velutinosus TaxID=708070 RepID=A0AAN7D6V5_9FUNG|nr:hypothetical protein ATC70_012833 [Mucor velutinosus]